MKKNSGFSLIEVIIAIFIFSLVMASTSVVFSKFYLGYRKAKETQRNIEEAQSIMNLMMKSMRTSSLTDDVADGESVRFYDHSQSKCIEYIFNNTDHNIKIYQDSYSGSGTNPIDWCKSHSFTSMSNNYLSNGMINNCSFTATQSGPNLVGTITVMMRICPKSGCPGNPPEEIRIQSTVSLRDYNVSGINP